MIYLHFCIYKWYLYCSPVKIWWRNSNISRPLPLPPSLFPLSPHSDWAQPWCPHLTQRSSSSYSVPVKVISGRQWEFVNCYVLGIVGLGGLQLEQLNSPAHLGRDQCLAEIIQVQCPVPWKWIIHFTEVFPMNPLSAGSVSSPRLWLQPGQLLSLLRQMVQERPGVLQIHAQHVEILWGFPRQRCQPGCKWQQQAER